MSIESRLARLEATQPARRRMFLVVGSPEDARAVEARHLREHPEDTDAEVFVIITGVPRSERFNDWTA